MKRLIVSIPWLLGARSSQHTLCCQKISHWNYDVFLLTPHPCGSPLKSKSLTLALTHYRMAWLAAPLIRFCWRIWPPSLAIATTMTSRNGPWLSLSTRRRKSHQWSLHSGFEQRPRRQDSPVHRHGKQLFNLILWLLDSDDWLFGISNPLHHTTLVWSIDCSLLPAF